MLSEKMRALAGLVRSVKSIAEDALSAGQVVEKAEFDYATLVDSRIQAFIFRSLERLYPGSQFMGEEGSGEAPDLDRPTWILDPIDGTTNLIHRYPQCGVSLALMEGREIALGIVYNPFLDQLFTAEKGMGAQLDGRPIRVSGIASLHDSLIAIGTSPYTKQYARHDFSVVGEFFERCQDIRRCGAAALEMAYVALGIVECFYERTLKPWDYAAGKLLVEEAGGRVSTFTGEAVPVGLPSSLLATNGHLHGEMLAYTQKMR